VPDHDANGRFTEGNSYSFRNRPEARNLKGRPKGTSIVDQLHKLLDDPGSGERLAQALVRAAVDQALRGDFRFWQEIINRIDGKVAQSHEVDAGSLTFILDEAVQSSRNGRA